MSKNPHESHDLDVQIKKKSGRKLSFQYWIEEYQINLSKLADEIGVTRQHLHHLKNKKTTASLEVALSIYYISGGLVSLFSLFKDDKGDYLRSELNGFINNTHKLNRSKISRGNKLTRYHLRLV